MLKKILVSLLLVTCLTGMVYGATYKEAIDAGMSKYKAGNYVGARTDWTEALNLATTGKDKSVAQLFVGHTYFREQNYTQARAEFAKVLEIVDALPDNKAIAYWYTGWSYFIKGNYPQARIGYAKVLAMTDSSPLILRYKLWAQRDTAYAYELEGNYDEATNAHKKILTMEGGNVCVKSLIWVGDNLREQADEAPLTEMKNKYYNAIRLYLKAKKILTKGGIEKNKKQIKQVNNKIIDIKKTMATLELE